MGDILFLAHRVPFPPDRGDKMRSYHLLRHLAGLARVHLATFADDPADMRHAEALRPLVGRLHVERRTRSTPVAGLAALAGGRPVSLAAFDSTEMRRAVTAMLAEEAIDTIFAFSGQMAQFVPDDGGRRFVMDFVDVDSAKFEDYAGTTRPPTRWLHRREARLLGAFEAAVAARADLSLFVSDAEAALFRARSGAERVATLENGIDLDFYRRDAAFPLLPAGDRGESPLIVFTGQMDYRPNVAAATTFAGEILPAIRRRHPDARFAIVGRNPVSALRKLDGVGGVHVTGAVPDVRSWLAAAAVVVAPLAIARGVQNKLLEAMAMARPVVASPAAFEGLEATPGRDLIVADGDTMASAVAGLLDDPARAAGIAAAGRAQVENRYAWGTRLAPLRAIVGREQRVPAVAAA